MLTRTCSGTPLTWWFRGSWFTVMTLNLLLNCRFVCSHHAHFHPPGCLLPSPGQVTAHALPTEDRGKSAFLLGSLSSRRYSDTHRWKAWRHQACVCRRLGFFIIPLSVFSLGGHFPSRGNHLHDRQLVAHRVRLDPQPPRLQRRSLSLPSSSLPSSDLYSSIWQTLSRPYQVSFGFLS